MVDQAKLAYALFEMIGYEHIVMCLYPHKLLELRRELEKEVG